MDNVANGQQIMHCTLSTAGPPLQRIAAGVRGVRTSVLQYNVRMTGQKKPKTYREYRHGEDGVDGDDGDFDGDGDGTGGGFDVMGGRPTNFGVAILA